jgi:hypothetical protein
MEHTMQNIVIKFHIGDNTVDFPYSNFELFQL